MMKEGEKEEKRDRQGGKGERRTDGIGEGRGRGLKDK